MSERLFSVSFLLRTLLRYLVGEGLTAEHIMVHGAICQPDLPFGQMSSRMGPRRPLDSQLRTVARLRRRHRPRLPLPVR